jgi:hypothetical protein
MAVKIPIVSVFDSRGVRQAQNQLKSLGGNVQSLGRNFAIAGAAFAGAAAVIVKSVQDLARIEKINAQTEAVLKSMGNSAGVTAEHIQDLSGNLEKLTATEAETIQEGANLLLTFRNIRNQVGENNNIFDQAVAISVDLARAMGTEASGEAIRLGKALNDPVKGIAALTRVGVSFTEQQKDQIKALQDSGDLLGAQKIILGELQAQFGGSGAAYAETFAGQLESLNHELGALGEEATMAVMPALQDMVAQFRELVPIIGPQIKAAMESVDWAGLIQTFVDFTKFLIENADAIAKVTVAIFSISTIYKSFVVILGLVKAAIAVAAAVQLIWNAALTANPIGLIVVAIAALIAVLAIVINYLVEMYGGWDKLFADIGGWISNFVTGFGDAMKQVGKFFTDVFTGFGDFFKAIINVWIGLFEGFINFILGGVNGIIGGLNEVLSGIKAATFGAVDLKVSRIPTVKIPRLAEGGLVMPRPGGVFANIAEAGQPEAVIPLDRLNEFKGKGDVIYNINVSGGLDSSATIGQAIVTAIRNYERQSGAAWRG